MNMLVDVEIPLGGRTLALDFETTDHVTGVFGPSGCGKTSLLEVIAGLRKASGTVRFGAQTWQDADTFVAPERRRIGYVPQGALLFPHLDVRGNLLAGAKRAREAGRDPERMLARIADLLELTELLDHDVDTLSGGEAGRVALGRALCSAPEVLLLDEPLAALDLALKRRVLPFLRRVREEYEIPIVLVSHDPTEVQALCDDLLVIRNDTIVARGSPRTTLADPSVLPDGPVGQLESVLECELEHVAKNACRVRAGETSVICLPTAGEVGDRKLLVIKASDIILATKKPEGLSARNTLAARIGSIEAFPDGRLVTLELDPDGPALLCSISADATTALDLEPGTHVFAVIKSTSCLLLDL